MPSSADSGLAAGGVAGVTFALAVVELGFVAGLAFAVVELGLVAGLTFVATELVFDGAGVSSIG